MFESAAWIWCDALPHAGWNLAARFVRDFHLAAVGRGELRIVADCRYRVRLNGEWIDDGPGRSYPEHCAYDVHDVTALLRPGSNRIEALVRHFGTGTYHHLPRQGGLLAEIAVDGAVVLVSDGEWQAAPLCGLRRWMPKASNQMEPQEWYDARLADVGDWTPARVLCAAGAGPWRDLTPRRPPLLARTRFRPDCFRGATAVRRDPPQACVPVAHLAHPGVMECNHSTSRPLLLAADLHLATPRRIDVTDSAWVVAIDGRRITGAVDLAPGRHAVLFACARFYGLVKDVPFPWLHHEGLAWSDWRAFIHEPSLFRDDDLVWISFQERMREQAQRGWWAALDGLIAAWSGPDRTAPGRQLAVGVEEIFFPDITADFAARVPVAAAVAVANGGALCAGADGMVRIEPCAGHDLELCWDLGVQRCGYLDVELEAAPGTILDLHLVEYIAADGTVQHPKHHRNGLRLVAGAGTTSHLSFKRRSGRFVFLTIRGQSGPVILRRLELIEATAPVAPAQRFTCSDPRLERIWAISERTLRLCMEDVFTDCPLYEQTLWIGDARNQALYAGHVYGETAVSARSLELGGQSLEWFPIVGCQVPSSWECLLPAWSFLWGIHVWEHFFHSGDRTQLAALWPSVRRNLDGAWSMRDGSGLFSGRFWNMLDWAPVDQKHATVLHNSLLLVGAFRAAERCAAVLGEDASELVARRERLLASLAAWYDPVRRSYPDALREDGTPSPQVCQHNAALGLLHGALPPGAEAHARRHLLDPPAGMTRMHSPFAAQFLLEALEAEGEADAVVSFIREQWGPMLDAGATTVWETFPGSTCSPAGFPTRSHCHGWSAAPLWFLGRVVLGIRQTAPGGTAFTISPWFGDLAHASGAAATPRGPLRVSWRREGGEAWVTVEAPPGVAVVFAANASHHGCGVRVTGC